MNPPDRHSTAAADRIPWSTLIAYGFGGLVPIAIFNIAGQLMSLIGNIGLGLSAFWLGVVLIIPRLWDALADPVVGHVSDNIRTPWGRRRPFLLIGGILVALSFVVMWWVPEHKTVSAWFASDSSYHWFQLGYILFWLLVFYSSCAIFEIPHGALGMEMTGDYHERTRLFSAKSFLGNLFAMGTPWLFALANLEFFKGPGGNEATGMRYVSMMVAAVLIPMSFWWFVSCREPGFEVAKKQEKSRFWESMRLTVENRTFLQLVAIIFTLAMGFNFVGLLSYYISIFYLYGGDKAAAGTLLGWTGTAWAVTGLAAVFPLNWISRRIGKSKTLGVAIWLMTAAQALKIPCYNPGLPYLVLIPTVLLSAGMLMFFTLGSSMLGDICDEDELKRGRRSEGSFYSVFWWFIKMGTAFASLVTGVLILLTHFDEKQTTRADEIHGHLNVVAKALQADGAAERKKIPAELAAARGKLHDLAAHFGERAAAGGPDARHYKELGETLDGIEAKLRDWNPETEPAPDKVRAVQEGAMKLAVQSPTTLLRLRIFEIGVPLLLCFISLVLLGRYPLTEERVYEIKALLKQRKADREPNA
jgi:glycoside/pentoside/hexuronide:cation symporter, GPH family